MLDPRFSEVKYIVEANSFENDKLYKFCKERDISWEQDNSGILLTVGNLAGRPICLSTTFVKINNMPMLFWYGCSQLVDYRMIDKWFDKYLPIKRDEVRNRTDAMNFHHAIHASNKYTEGELIRESARS